MLKKTVTLLCLIMLVLSVMSVAVVSSGYAGDGNIVPMNAPSGFCGNPNCGTQNCWMFWIAFCIGDGFVWH